MKDFSMMILEAVQFNTMGIMPKAVNPCGGCNVCCVAPAISKEDGEWLGAKPACQACPMSTKSDGCKAYSNRPSVCRNYLCLYSLGYTDTRPDQDGVAWTIQPDLSTNGGLLMIGHALDADAVFQSGAALRFMRRAVKSGIFCSVVVRSDKKVIRIDALKIHPDLEALVNQDDPAKMEVDEGSATPTRHTLNLADHHYEQ